MDVTDDTDTDDDDTDRLRKFATLRWIVSTMFFRRTIMVEAGEADY